MRNRFAIIAVAMALLGSLAFATGTAETSSEPAEPVTVLSHPVHETVIRGGEGQGEDLVPPFTEEFGAQVEFQTMPSGKLLEQLYRVGPLNNTSEDIVFLLAESAVPTVANFLTPLDPYLEDSPIEGFPDDWSGGILENYTIDGNLYAIPVRSGTYVLWYNQDIFEERGIDGPPKTPEELYEIAAQTTFTRSSGEQVFGFSTRGTRWDLRGQLAIMARMWEGDIITPDGELVITDEPVVKALTLYQRMYQEGLMPSEWATMGSSENVRLFQEGRVAMVLEGHNYNATFNDPEVSSIAGAAVPAHVPLAREFWTEERDFSVSYLWDWAMAIFSGSRNKDLAWEFVRHTSSRDSRVQMMRSGNAPARVSVLSMQVESDPGARIASEIFPVSKPAIPPVNNYNEIVDVIGQHVHEIVVNGADVTDELEQAAERVQALLDE